MIDDPWDKDGGPAYPTMTEVRTGAAVYKGMTLRDWLAGQALTGIVSVSGNGPDEVARQCYAYADAMLEARKAEK